MTTEAQNSSEEPARRKRGRPKGVRELWPRTTDKDLKRFFQGCRLTLEKTGRSPVQIMLEAMINVYEEQGAVAAYPYAERVAPYMYAKMASIDIMATVDETKSYVISTGKPQTREEWLAVWANPDDGRKMIEQGDSNTP